MLRISLFTILFSKKDWKYRNSNIFIICLSSATLNVTLKFELEVRTIFLFEENKYKPCAVLSFWCKKGKVSCFRPILFYDLNAVFCCLTQISNVCFCDNVCYFKLFLFELQIISYNLGWYSPTKSQIKT